MSERRSGRQRKPPKYSTFDDESDDDFADTTPPPPKKPKATTKKEGDKGLPVLKTVADISITESVKKRRAPLAEKIYERELQKALEISLVDSQEEKKDESSSAAKEPPIITQDENMPQLQSMGVKDTGGKLTNMPSLKHINSVLVDDSIEVLNEGTIDLPPLTTGRTRRTSGNQSRTTTVNANKKSQSDSDDESDYDMPEEEDDDSDFGCDSKPARNKKTPVKKQAAPSKAKGKDTGKSKVIPSKAAATPTSSKPVSKANLPIKAETPSLSSTLKSSVITTSLVSPSRQPTAKCVMSPLTASWKPPAPASSQTSSPSIATLKSPSSGLRLGLSRNQRVKPLHPSVNVS